MISKLSILGSRGQAQLLLDLEPSNKYYVNIRAITGAGNALDSATDGVMVDTSAPSVEIHNVGRPVTDASNNETQRGIVYQRDPDTIPAEWSVEDGESPISELDVMVGTVPGVWLCSL